MTASTEEIARDILLADIASIAAGPQEERAGKIVAAFKEILDGIEQAQYDMTQRRRSR